MKKILVILLSVFLAGCASTGVKRGVDKKDNIFYSSSHPNIQIQLPAFATYKEGKKGQMQHQFSAKRTTIYIHSVTFRNSGHNIDYFYNPESWLFSNVPGSEIINKGALTILDKKWYYCNSLKKKGQSTYFIRNLGYFAPNYNQFYIRFIKRLSYDESQVLDDRQFLTSKHYELIHEIIKTFDDKIKISTFVSGGERK